MAGLIIDIIIVAVLIGMIIYSAKKGFLDSLAGVIIVVAAFWGASWIAKQISPAVAQWLQPVLEDRLTAKAYTTTSADAGGVLRVYGFCGEALLNMTQQVVDNITATGEAMITAVVDSVVSSIAYAIVYVVSFVLLALTLWLFSKPLKLATKLPGLHALNVLGGGILGLIKGVLVIYVAVWALQRFQVITPEMMDGSILLGMLAAGGPLMWVTTL